MTTRTAILRQPWWARLAAYLAPLLALLNPGPLMPAVAVSLVVGVTIGWLMHLMSGTPPWSITALALVALLPVGVLKWRADYRAYGATVTLLSVLLLTQGAHTIEHIVQWVQYYVLYLPARQSSGLISAANSEWVHFIWNWGVLLVVALLWQRGMRGRVAGVLLAVVIAHAVEHTYLFVRYHMVLGELSQLDVRGVTAQGLAGIVGRDGWLARSPLTQGTFLCTLPGLTTA
ncbi:MAG TPA: hypothetical protein PKA05_20200, partial [Roseiflexaceae bacterium]|nr:hypothetical protein [Roseiflexaceae bacterium]